MGLAGFPLLALATLATVSGAEMLPLNVKVGNKAPDFALPSASGRTVRISEYAGHNILIDFYRGYW
jgi:hypothetical protein